MFKQFGVDSWKRNEPIVPSITYAPILVFTDRYNDSLRAFLWSFLCIKHTLNRQHNHTRLNFYIGLTIIVPIFDLSISSIKINSGKGHKKSGNLYSNLHRNPGCAIQHIKILSVLVN